MTTPFGNIKVINKKEKNFQVDGSKLEQTRQKMVDLFNEVLLEDVDHTQHDLVYSLTKSIENAIYSLSGNNSATKQYRDKVNAVKMNLKGNRNI